MGLFKILFSGLAILTICVRVQSRGMREVNIKDQQDPVQVKECYCISSNSQSTKVSQHISPDGEQHDRLVVYLYKDHNNNVITFIPGKEKQRFLPDLTLDAGDKLENIDVDHVDQLFNLYPELVVQSKDIAKPGKQGDGLSYNTFNMGFIQGLPNIIEIGQAQGVDKTEMQDSKPNRQMELSWEEQPQISSNDNIINQENPVKLPVIHIPSSPDASSNKIIKIPKVEVQPDNTVHVIQIKPETLNIPAPIKIPQAKNLENIDIENAWLPPPAVPEDDNDQLLSDESLHTDNINVPEDFIFNNIPEIQKGDQNLPSSDSSILEFSDTTKIKPTVEKPTLSNNYVGQATSYLDNLPLTLQHYQQGINKHFIFPNNIHPKFRKWFWDQIKLLEMKRPTMTSKINLSNLLTVILKILYQNGIIISSSGDLKHTSGNIIPISSLRLHSILLNDSNKKSTGCYIPKDSQNLETVLVALIAPPKILGIITLGDANSSNKNYDVSIPCKSSICKNRPCCKNWPCYKKMKVNHIDINKKLPEILVKKDHGSLLVSKPNKNSLLGSFIKSRRLSEDPDTEIREETSVEDFFFNDEVQEVEDIESIDLEDYDDSLGIRIIGGTPATSSGTPVNIRGRSGLAD